MMAEVPEEKSPTGLDISDLAKDAFHKVADYMNGELEASADDYVMLDKMNKITSTRYSEMKQVVAGVNTAMQDLNNKYKSLEPYIEQIDEIEKAVSELEQSAYKLDAYSKQLEARFRQLEKK